MEKITWTSNLAYAVGLLTTDGNLSKDGRHLELTSTDIEQLENFKKCLDIKTKISWKTGGYTNRLYPRIQFGNVKLYQWLLGIGLMPNKTKVIAEIRVPDKYFFEFLRGHFDGDGSVYAYFDPRWKSSYMFYLTFTSASMKHIIWLQERIQDLSGFEGKINEARSSRVIQLRYAKQASKEIFKKMYRNKQGPYLTRKYKKAKKILRTCAEVEKLVNSQR